MNYYNEFDPYAAAWLRNLIAAGRIAPGEVDERSIEDVRPGDLAGFTQCHFFAGVGAWSYALRLAGWGDTRRVWTGSCPCQPFSAAGKGGGFDDERHLWPAWFQLIAQCRPKRIFGEQVASKDGLAWLDLVHTDLEAAGYAVGAVDLCAAGVGAPHIRQRSWFVADADDTNRRASFEHRANDQYEIESRSQSASGVGKCGESCRLADHGGARLEGQRERSGTEGGRINALRSIAESGESGGMGDTTSGGFGIDGSAPGHGGHVAQSDAACRPGPTNGRWRDVDWLFCRDGKWRPVEPGTFPLAHESASRLGRLRAYGNAINAQAAAEFIRAVM